MLTKHQLQELAVEVASIIAHGASKSESTMAIENGTESPETRKRVEYSEGVAKMIVDQFETESEQFEVLSRVRTAMTDHWQNERHRCLDAAEFNQRRVDRLSDFIKEACV